MNPATVLVLLLLAAWGFFAVRSILRGKSACGKDCAHCKRNCRRNGGS